MKKIIGIMAATKDGVVGYKNHLPWDYPDELAHFKETTKGHVLIMGHKTYHDTEKELFKSRTAMVLSRNNSLKLDDALVFNDLDKLLQSLDDAKTFMIGGAEIANLFLKNNLLSSFILTEIKKSYAGDSYLDLDYLKNWPRTTLKDAEHYTIYNLINPKESVWNL